MLTAESVLTHIYKRYETGSSIKINKSFQLNEINK